MDRTRRQYVVAETSEIPPGAHKIVQVGGRSIGVFNLDGDYVAIGNVCPHAGAPLCRGQRSGFVRSDRPGEYEYIRRGEVLRCPWHQWEFDLRTGRSWFDPEKVRVRTYDVRVAPAGEAADQGAAEQAAAGPEPGPYTATTYDVHTSDELVIVTL